MIAVIGLCLTGRGAQVMAQQFPLTGCTSGHDVPVPHRGWPQGTTVSVYIHPAITDARRSSVEAAFINWNQSSGLNGSNNYYQFVTQPPPANTGFTVLNQQSSIHRATTTTATNDTTGDTMYAITYVTEARTREET